MKRARESAIIGGSLLAMCCLMHGAAAFEPGQAAVPSQAEAALPSFLDGNRLLDLQEAWRALPRAPLSAPQPDAGVSPPSTPDEKAAMKAARSAMKRADQDLRGAAAVRKRAEELSQRFGAGAAAPAAKPAAPEPKQADEAPIVSTPPYAIGADPSADRGQQASEPGHEMAAPAAAGASHLGADTATGALPDAAAPLQNTSQPPTSPLRRKAAMPPLPQRAPKLAEASADPPVVRKRNKAVTISRPAPTRSRSDAQKEVFPPYMHSFGWSP